jgi:hypothetical protein
LTQKSEKSLRTKILRAKCILNKELNSAIPLTIHKVESMALKREASPHTGVNSEDQRTE